MDTGGGGDFGGAWDSARWDEDIWGSAGGAWEDATQYVIQVDTTAGAQRWGDRFEAGTASVYLNNVEGIFTPISGVEAPFFREWQLGRRIRLVAIPDPDTDVKVPLWTGRIESSYDTYVDAQYGITTVLQCVDFMGDLVFSPTHSNHCDRGAIDQRSGGRGVGPNRMALVGARHPDRSS